MEATGNDSSEDWLKSEGERVAYRDGKNEEEAITRKGNKKLGGDDVTSPLYQVVTKIVSTSGRITLLTKARETSVAQFSARFWQEVADDDQ